MSALPTAWTSDQLANDLYARAGRRAVLPA
jgi:hypothetical protein